MGVIFNTNDCAPHQRLTYWHQMIREHHTPVRLAMPEQRPPSKNDFKGWSKVFKWGRLQVFHTISSPVSYDHGAQEIRGENDHDFLCILVQDGHCSYKHRGEHIDLRKGDLVFYDTRQMYTLGFPDDINAITLRVPRPAVLSRLPDADKQFAIGIRGAKPLGHLLGSMMKSISERSDHHMDTSEAETPLLDVVRLAVQDSLGYQNRVSPGQERMIVRIKKDLIQELEDSSLGVHSIARRHNISPSTLNRMFAAEGTTVMKWVWGKRLAESYRALSEGKVRQVTEAAYLYGFKDTSHFSRAFKKEYNISPSVLCRNH